MALHKPKQLYVLGKPGFSSIKSMKMIEIWLRITFIFINGLDFPSGIKSVCDECTKNVFFFTSGNRIFFLSRMFTPFASDRIKFPCMKKIKNWFFGQNNIYTSLGKKEFTSLLTVYWIWVQSMDLDSNHSTFGFLFRI
jgi:hypothetical protein